MRRSQFFARVEGHFAAMEGAGVHSGRGRAAAILGAQEKL